MRLLLTLAAAILLTGSALAETPIAADAIQSRIAEAIASRMPASGHYKVSLADPAYQLVLPDAAQNRWQIAALTYNPAQQSFQATLGFVNEQGTNEYVALSGRALAVIDVPAFTRDIAIGETINDTDITTLEFPAGNVGTSLITSQIGLAGQAARRVVRAHTPLYTYDVAKPVTIKKGELVTVTFSLPGIQLTTQGQALNNAGKGDTVSILNPSSRRTIEARVTGPGAAIVSSSGAAIASAN